MKMTYVTIPCYKSVSMKSPDWRPNGLPYKLCVRPRSIVGYTVDSDGCSVLLSNGTEHFTHATEAELRQYISGELMDSSLNYLDAGQEEYHKTYTMQR